MRKSEGFTLIELMIVIAIIAIIAAIAIPGLLQSQRASNERNASASLKTLASAEADFRGNDRDGNKVQDYWTADVAGLFTLCPVGVADPIKLIELSIAGADFNDVGTSAVAAETLADVTNFTRLSPKAGFWYRAMITDDSPTPTTYRTDTQSSEFGNATFFNYSKFGFLTFPDSHSSGRSIFIINEGNTIYKVATTTTCKPAATPPNSTAIPATTIAGSAGVDTWPNDTSLKANYSKLD